MSIVTEIHQERQELARVLKRHTGIRKIVEDLYPDSVHFIYELLQNAEDTGATEATFILSHSSLLFEHNGRSFDAADIYAITDIGEGTKVNVGDKIGRFGIGFKAVFAYTETPRIWSPTFSFQIDDLVLPSELTVKPELEKITCFEFPFNNSKKPPNNAYAEVLSGLNELSETTLLFLSHIQSIRWQVQGKREGEVLRVSHSEYHIEVLKQTSRDATTSSHFLHFKHPAENLGTQDVAVAFALDTLPTVAAFDPKMPLAKQFRIVPAVPGCVAVFFAAEKETSGLRFHLHAPFVPELSRASIKDTLVNQPLFQQLAVLAAHVLPEIRDLGLLTSDFLAVLPNLQDNIPVRYQCIRDAIITAMNEQPLTPTQSRSHAPAKHLLQAKASLKALLSAEDIASLVDYEEVPPNWAIGAAQKNSDADRFLAGLAISEWDIEQFVEVLEEKLGTEKRFSNAAFRSWLSAKPGEWHQKLYALLYRELEPKCELHRLKDLCIVRLGTGEYRAGNKCYFPSDEVEQDAVLLRVAKAVYMSGKSKAEQVGARSFLETIGVREVGEAEQVEAILKERYSYESEIPDQKTYENDLKRFLSLVERGQDNARLFNNFWIFECADSKWRKPSGVYLDTPYYDTDLSAYYGALGKDADCAALAPMYQEMGIPKDKLAKFCQASGAQTELYLIEVNCSSNLKKDYLYSAPGQRRTSGRINRDWYFPRLHEVIDAKNIEVSRLIWRTMCDDSSRKLEAIFRQNASSELRTAPSRVLNWLVDREWVPQGESIFVRPSEASRDLLPEGFAFDPGWAWLKAIHFGEEITKRTEEHRKKREVARELGFDDDEALNDAKWFARLHHDERERLKAEYKGRGRTELPDHEPSNPDRRTTRVGEQAIEAPERVTEKRMRSISVGREAIKMDADSYLRQQYSNSDGEMICQVCKTALPFKLADGNYYFEAVEFLPELRRCHYQNYLAFCPNHAAMFQHANDDRGLIRERFLNLASNQLAMVLAGEDVTIYFTKTHIADLKVVIAADQEAITVGNTT